jgi:hypothetical protein
MKSGFIASAVLLSLSLSGYAVADEDCSDPVADWQPRETLRQQVQQQYGWSVQRIKVDDGCYEIRGLDRKGNAIEASYSPASCACASWRSASRTMAMPGLPHRPMTE